MRTYVSTIGFHATRVNRPIHQYGLEDGNRVVLLRPAAESASGQAEDAVGYVEDMLHEMASDVSVETEYVETTEFTSAVLTCCNVFEDAEGELVVNFGGGAREVFLPLVIAAVLSAPRIDTALQYTDVDHEIHEWPVPDLMAGPPSEAWPTLEAVVRAGECSIPELVDSVPKSKSTVSRHVSKLAACGVIETWMEGQTKFVKATPTAEFLHRGSDFRE